MATMWDCAPTRRRQGPGFTLVELLVVLGIIAVLVSILMPVIAAAQRKSRIAACAGQLYNVGAAIAMYRNENRGRFPLAPSLPSVNPFSLPTFMDCLDTYVGSNRKVFRCPADEKLFLEEGTSFFYYAELGERKVEDTFLCKVLKSVNNVPALWDADNFHGGNLPYNWLLVDGRVEQFITQAPKEDPP